MKKIKNDFLKDLKEVIKQLEEKGELPGEKLAHIVSTITNFEIKEGGPYSIKPKDGIKNADFGFNLLIAYFLLLCKVELPNLDNFINERIKKASSVFLSKNELNNLIEKWQKLSIKNKDIKSIKKIEKLYKTDEEKTLNSILKIAEKRFANLSGEFKDIAMREIKKVINANRDKQMSLMSFYTKQALGKKGKKISDDLIAEMGLANIFFWAAFIIYDDFWDKDEAADPHILPTANLFSRHYIDLFTHILGEETGFRKFFHKLMDDLDEANTWETLFCRTEVHNLKFVIPEKLPDYANYENKYRPASGHILGPVAIFLKLGYSFQSSEVKNFISYFKNYLIAMQLNDDAHDWQEDMARGHLSTVVVLLLKDLKKSGWNKPTIDLVSDLPELKKIFWFKTIKKYSKIAQLHAEASQKALESIKIFEDILPLLRFSFITKNVAMEAEKEQKNSIDFLNAYSK